MALLRETSKRRGMALFGARALAAIVTMGVLCVIAEVGVRLSVWRRGPGGRATTMPDEELGWIQNTNSAPFNRFNLCGERVVTTPAPDPFIRKFPRYRGGSRVLFLGDSTTHAHEVSVGSAYFDVFEAEMKGKYEVYAAGVGGYGNYQEYLLATKIFSRVRPSVIVWQLDANDVVNNVSDLERWSLTTNRQERPFLDPRTGDVFMRRGGLRLFEVSHLARELLSLVVGIDRKYGLDVVKDLESLAGPRTAQRLRLEKQGLDVLARVVSQFVLEHGDTRVVGFSATASLAFDEEFEAIFRERAHGYISKLPSLLAKNGERFDCRPQDLHWNHRGNEIVGKLLATRFKESSWLGNQPPFNVPTEGKQ